MAAALRRFSAPLALLLYFAVSSNSAPVDVAVHKQTEAKVTCGVRPERFLSHRYVYATTAVRQDNIESCANQSAYPPSAMVDGLPDTWWQSTSRRNIIRVLGPSTQFDAQISTDLQQVCYIPTFTRRRFDRPLKVGRPMLRPIYLSTLVFCFSKRLYRVVTD